MNSDDDWEELTARIASIGVHNNSVALPAPEKSVEAALDTRRDSLSAHRRQGFQIEAKVPRDFGIGSIAANERHHLPDLPDDWYERRSGNTVSQVAANKRRNRMEEPISADALQDRRICSAHIRDFTGESTGGNLAVRPAGRRLAQAGKGNGASALE